MLLNGLFLAIFGWKWWFLDRLPLWLMKGRNNQLCIKLFSESQKGQNTINLSEFPTGILIFAVGDQRFKVLKE
jgi:hypothetical protein